MSALSLCRAILFGSAASVVVVASGVALAVPEQVIPENLETGSPTFAFAPGAPGQQGAPGQSEAGAPSSSGSPLTTGGVTGSGSSYERMMAQTYGQTALATAQQLGINPNAIAGIGLLESNFQNVGTANGSSSATGPWQITNGTWNGIVSSHNLPYTAADRTNTDAQAVVANYILKDYSASVSMAIQQPATVQQAYGAYVFGPSGGAGLAGAASNAPMSNYVSATALSNNNMTGWTVGQFYQRVQSKIGEVATQTVSSRG